MPKVTNYDLAVCLIEQIVYVSGFPPVTPHTCPVT